MLIPPNPSQASNYPSENFELLANTYTSDFDYKKWQKTNLVPPGNSLFFLEYMMYRVNSEEQRLRDAYNFYERSFRDTTEISEIKSWFDDYVTKIIIHGLSTVESFEKKKNDELPDSLSHLKWLKIYEKTFKKKFEFKSSLQITD